MIGAERKLLVVDDDPFVLEMLTLVLEEEGYAVTAAESGEDALQEFDRDPGICLVLTDMNMPGMSGLHLTREIRSRCAATPILLLSARDDGDLLRRATESGAHRCLVKDEDLIERIADEVAQALHSAPESLPPAP